MLRYAQNEVVKLVLGNISILNHYCDIRVRIRISNTLLTPEGKLLALQLLPFKVQNKQKRIIIIIMIIIQTIHKQEQKQNKYIINVHSTRIYSHIQNNK